jgi:hypothetical protein
MILSEHQNYDSCIGNRHAGISRAGKLFLCTQLLRTKNRHRGCRANNGRIYTIALHEKYSSFFRRNFSIIITLALKATLSPDILKGNALVHVVGPSVLPDSLHAPGKFQFGASCTRGMRTKPFQQPRNGEMRSISFRLKQRRKCATTHSH